MGFQKYAKRRELGPGTCANRFSIQSYVKNCAGAHDEILRPARDLRLKTQKLALLLLLKPKNFLVDGFAHSFLAGEKCSAPPLRRFLSFLPHGSGATNVQNDGKNGMRVQAKLHGSPSPVSLASSRRKVVGGNTTVKS